jgi:hypothetical protein
VHQLKKRINFRHETLPLARIEKRVKGSSGLQTSAGFARWAQNADI